jgi:FAD/FMN-containing dehydrogenase
LDPDRLQCMPGVQHTWAEPFAQFADRASTHLRYWKRSGLWQAAHPWLNVILPGSAATSWLASLADELDPLDPADGPIMIYPVRRGATDPSMLQLPRATYSVRIDVLRSAVPDAGRSIASLMRANRRAYDACVAAGGVQYPSAALDMRPGDWRRHFGASWSRFERLRRRYDPDGVLTPGQGITATRRRG